MSSAAKLSHSHCKRNPLSSVSFGERSFDQPCSFDRFHSLGKEEKESNEISKLASCSGKEIMMGCAQDRTTHLFHLCLFLNCHLLWFITMVLKYFNDENAACSKIWNSTDVKANKYHTLNSDNKPHTPRKGVHFLLIRFVQERNCVWRTQREGAIFPKMLSSGPWCRMSLRRKARLHRPYQERVFTWFWHDTLYSGALWYAFKSIPKTIARLLGTYGRFMYNAPVPDSLWASVQKNL